MDQLRGSFGGAQPYSGCETAEHSEHMRRSGPGVSRRGAVNLCRHSNLGTCRGESVTPNQQCQTKDQHGHRDPELDVSQYRLRDVRFRQAGCSPSGQLPVTVATRYPVGAYGVNSAKRTKNALKRSVPSKNPQINAIKLGTRYHCTLAKRSEIPL